MSICVQRRRTADAVTAIPARRAESYLKSSPASNQQAYGTGSRQFTLAGRLAPNRFLHLALNDMVKSKFVSIYVQICFPTIALLAAGQKRTTKIHLQCQDVSLTFSF